MRKVLESDYSLKSIFTNYAFFEIFVLGILSGMPFSVLYTTLLVMLKDIGFNLSTATSIALALMPYSLKFLWAPLVDSVEIKFLGKIGRRKSWMILSLALNIVLLTSMTYITSFGSFQYIFAAAFIYCIISATYDIAFDAWRIERVGSHEIAISASVAIFGYRIGALLTGAGALYINEVTESWNFTMIILGVIFFIGGVFVTTTSDTILKPTKFSGFNFVNNVINPFRDFLSKPLAIHILLAIILYKAGEAMISFVSTPFYLELGFSKSEVASVVKVFGVAATTLGSFCGAFICLKMGYMRGLIICGIIQMLSNLMFIWMHAQGANMSSLFIIVAIDNFSGGMGSVSLVGYLGSLCNLNYTATQYALLSSATTLINHSIVSTSGALVAKVGWDMFFASTVLMSLPSLFLLRYISRKSPVKNAD
ncbi:MAG: hypothetical protein RLZZ59_544 [Pseudomonadota bacterium]|jgi:PAT family beta-lactamase induction signal transducer AmpG